MSAPGNGQWPATAPSADRLPSGAAGADGPLHRIRATLPGLPGALLAGANLVLTNAWEVRGLSIHDFAARAGVSAHAVNRLARRLGYSGYREFLQALALELGQMVGAAYAIPEPLARELPAAGTAADDPASLVSRVFRLELAALQDTQRSLDPEQVRRAVETLADATGIVFVSTGAGMAVADLAVYRLKVLGLRAWSVAEQSAMIPDVHLLRPGEVVVGLTYHGQAANVLDALAMARRRGLTTISITAVPDSPASRAADISLVVSSSAEALGFGQFASRVTTMTLLEALAAAVAWKRRDVSLPHANDIWLETQRLNPPRQEVDGGAPRRGRRARFPSP